MDHVGQLVDSHGIDCDYEKPGLLTVATNKAQVRRLQREIKLAEKLGIEGLQWLDTHRTQAEVPSPTYLGARWDGQCALMNMAGQIMRDLVLERQSEFADLFFVNRWLLPLPPEPLCFVLGRTLRYMFKAQDAWEARAAGA